MIPCYAMLQRQYIHLAREISWLGPPKIGHLLHKRSLSKNLNKFIGSRLTMNVKSTYSTDQIDRKHPVVHVGTHDLVHAILDWETHSLRPKKYRTYNFRLICLPRTVHMRTVSYSTFIKIWATGLFASVGLKRLDELRTRFLIVSPRLVS